VASEIILLIAIAWIASRFLRKRGGMFKGAKSTSPAKLKTGSPRYRQIYTVLTFAKISVRRYFRDRVAIFFTIAFPLIFLLVFGLTSKNNDVSFHIGLVNQSHSQFAQKFASDIKSSKTFKVDDNVTNLSEAQVKMGRSEIDATLVLPSNFGETGSNNVPSGQAVIYYDENNAQAAQTMQAVLQGRFEAINAKLVKTQAPFSVAAKSTNNKGLTRLDYTVSGLIGFAIIGLGIFGPVNYFPQMKKEGVLRRLHITPLRVWQFFISSVLSNAVIGLLSIGIMIAVATVLLNFKMVGNYFELAILLVFGILTIFGIGLAIGGWAKNENQAAPLANIIVFPMLFLSGTFFPRFAMPEWLQQVTAFLPLTPIIDGIRMIATEGKHLTEIGPQLGLIALWAVIIYAIAFRVFRWE
jgi:ABC-2 type transport system permease protein